MREFVFCCLMGAGFLTLSGCQQDPATDNANGKKETKSKSASSYVGTVDVPEPTGDDKVTMGAKLFVSKEDPTAGTVAVRVRLQEGWHLYATLGPDAFERQAELELNEIEGVTEDGEWVLPPAKSDDKDVLKTLWEGDLVFTQKVSLGNFSGKPSVNFSYQACNENSCLPPTKTDIPVEK